MRLHFVAGLLALGLLLAPSGCKPKSKELKRWAWVDTKLQGADTPLTCDADLVGASMTFDFDKAPDGTKITVQGKDYTPAAGKLHVDVDVGEMVGAIKTSDAIGPSFEWNPHIPIVLTLPNGTITTESPTLKYGAVGRGLKAAAGKPITFGKEPARAANGSVVWIGLDDELFGTAPTLRDLDAIAVEGDSKKSTPGPTCHYRDPKTGATSTAQLTILAEEAVVYDRKTGKVLDRKLFAGSPSCPLEKEQAEQGVASGVTDDQIKAWLKTRHAKK